MEGWGVFAAIREKGEEFGHFEEAAGPWVEMVLALIRCLHNHMYICQGRKDLTPMTEQQRNRPLNLTPLPHKMHFQSLKPINPNLSTEIRQLIHLSFMFPPVVSVFPIGGETFYIGQGGAIVPARLVELIGEVDEGEFLGEAVDFAGGDGDGVGDDGGHF